MSGETTKDLSESTYSVASAASGPVVLSSVGKTDSEAPDMDNPSLKRRSVLSGGPPPLSMISASRSSKIVFGGRSDLDSDNEVTDAQTEK
jgi:hypothetical protein